MKMSLFEQMYFPPPPIIIKKKKKASPSGPPLLKCYGGHSVELVDVWRRERGGRSLATRPRALVV
jgi:hypothetical protein